MVLKSRYMKENEFDLKKCELALKKVFSDDKTVLKALKTSKSIHKDQVRKSGLPYISHPLSIALHLGEKYNDVNLSSAALLHDTVEDDENVTIKDIYDKFGKEIGFIVDSQNKYEKGFYEFPKLNFKDKIDRLLWAGIKDVRVLLLKIADREHNIQTLQYLKENKQVRMAFETQAIFEPLKKILCYDDNISLSEIEKKLKSFLSSMKIDQNNMKDISRLRQYFYKETFNNFDDESFALVYNNSANVVWRVEGIEMFRTLCSLKAFKDKIDLISIQSNGSWIHTDFRFLEGAISHNDENLKMSISTFDTK